MNYLMEDYDRKNYAIYSYSYTELQKDFRRYKYMSDVQFKKNINNILHFAIFVCYLKEIPTYLCLADTGIIHELFHVLDDINGNSLKNIRKLFNMQLDLGNGPWKLTKAARVRLMQNGALEKKIKTNLNHKTKKKKIKIL